MHQEDVHMRTLIQQFKSFSEVYYAVITQASLLGSIALCRSILLRRIQHGHKNGWHAPGGACTRRRKPITRSLVRAQFQFCHNACSGETVEKRAKKSRKAPSFQVVQCSLVSLPKMFSPRSTAPTVRLLTS